MFFFFSPLGIHSRITLLLGRVPVGFFVYKVASEEPLSHIIFQHSCHSLARFYKDVDEHIRCIVAFDL
jgi:hypothetical protein